MTDKTYFENIKEGIDFTIKAAEANNRIEFENKSVGNLLKSLQNQFDVLCQEVLTHLCDLEYMECVNNDLSDKNADLAKEVSELKKKLKNQEELLTNLGVFNS